MHQPDFQLTYRRPVLNLTVRDNALSSKMFKLRQLSLNVEMTLLPWFVENEWIEILLYPNGHNDL